MSATATCKVFSLGNAPARIELLGDKTKRPESAQHVIEFPGGAIELSRTSKNEYWAHIIVNGGQVVEGAEGISGARGVVVDGRIDRPDGVVSIPGVECIRQIAILIRSTGRAA